MLGMTWFMNWVMTNHIGQVKEKGQQKLELTQQIQMTAQ